MKDFLVVKTSSIGDVIQCFHLLDFLQERFPGCRIDWVCEKAIAPLLQSHPAIENVLEVDTKTWRKNLFKSGKEIKACIKSLRIKRYDTLFDLQGNTKSGLITGFARARHKVGFSWKAVAEKPNFLFTTVHVSTGRQTNARERYLQLVQNYFGEEMRPRSSDLRLQLQPREEKRLERLGQLGFQRPRIMVCFGSNWENKQLSEDSLSEFIRRIDEKLSPSFFFIYSSEKEKRIADRLEAKFSASSHAVGEMSLPLWQRFMGLVECVITMDSAALHLCATTKTPTFSIFGPSSAKVYKPLGGKHEALQGSCPFEVSFEKRCPYLRSCKSGQCIKDLSGKDLHEQFDAFWNRVSEDLFVHS